MGRPPVDAQEMSLDDYIEAYENAQAGGGAVDLADHLPPSADPLYLPVLRELVRVDLEYTWQRGAPRPLGDYQKRFPALFQDRPSLQAMAFEEYRLRQQAGQNPSPKEYQRRFGIDVGNWPVTSDTPSPFHIPTPTPAPLPPVPPVQTQTSPLPNQLGFAEAALACQINRDRAAGLFHGSAEQIRFHQELQRSDPHAASRYAEAITTLPEEGVDFLGFRLLRELGQGAFGRVYLAQQGGLANRFVALKVAADLHGEAQTLAQLQHTNIVPIYSVHYAAPFQAVCMPYFGSTTLAHILKDLENRPSLPESGKGLISTLEACKQNSSTLKKGGSNGSGKVPAAALAKSLPDEVLALPRVGSSTDTLRKLEGFTYVEAVLWLASRLADGLAHAHDHGILHLDLKPANVLLTDEGQPMLLDFNLSADLKKLRRGPTAAMVGGTLPYMAPEHLEAFRGADRTVDRRSDLFSLGVILFELLTGRHPFPVHRGQLQTVLVSMIKDRLAAPPSVRQWNLAVTPATEAILRKCLDPDPRRRYQSARELCDDLECQLANRPLKHLPEPSLGERLAKWRRRHPRLTSATTVGTVAGVLLLGGGAYGAFTVAEERERRQAAEHQKAVDDLRVKAQATHLRFRRQAQEVLERGADPQDLPQALVLGRRALDLYHVDTDSAWQETALVRFLPEADQPQLKTEVGNLLLVLAGTQTHLAQRSAAGPRRQADLEEALRWNRAAEPCFAQDARPVFLVRQRVELLTFLGRRGEAEPLLAAAQGEPRTLLDQGLLAQRFTLEGKLQAALPLWLQVCTQDTENLRAAFYAAKCHAVLAQYAGDGYRLDREADECMEAVRYYGECLVRSPRHPRYLFERGLALLRLKKYPAALVDFTKVIEARLEGADLANAYLNRGLANRGMQRWQEAADDFTAALNLPGAPTRLWKLRAGVRQMLKDADGAGADYREFLRREPADVASWDARGYARLEAKDVAGALADFDQALALDPCYLPALMNKANVLDEHLGRLEPCLAVLDVVVERHPDFLHGRASRGVVLARLGRREKALADAEAVLKAGREPVSQYQVACIYALLGKDNPDYKTLAVHHLTAALQAPPQLRQWLALDNDLDNLRKDPEFQKVVEAVRVLHRADPAAAQR